MSAPTARSASRSSSHRLGSMGYKGGDAATTLASPLPARPFVEQHAPLEAGRLPPAQVLNDVAEGHAGINDVLDKEHVPSAEVQARVEQEGDVAGHFAAEGGGGGIIDLDEQVDVPHQIVHERGDALEHPDEHRRRLSEVLGDGPSQGCD